MCCCCFQNIDVDNLEDYVGYELPAKFVEIDEVKRGNAKNIQRGRIGLPCTPGVLVSVTWQVDQPVSHVACEGQESDHNPDWFC